MQYWKELEKDASSGWTFCHCFQAMLPKASDMLVQSEAVAQQSAFSTCHDLEARLLCFLINGSRQVGSSHG